MDFLQGIEIVRLQEVIKKHPKIRMAETRPAVLTLCGLDEGLSSLQTQGNADLFVTLLLAECSDVNFVNKKGNHALVELLNYLYPDHLSVHACKITKGDRIFIKEVIRRCGLWQKSVASPQQRQDMIASALAHLEQSSTSLSPFSSKSIHFDKNTIIGYDLDRLIGDFAEGVELGQASAFSLVGEYDMLKEYILERMYQKLSQKTVSRPYQSLEISINAHDVKRETIIREMVLQKYKCQSENIAELLSKYPKQDIVLLIWNYSPVMKPLKMALSYLWSELQRDVVDFLKKSGLCFVVILAHVGQNERAGSIENFTRLRLQRERFTRSALEPWLDRTLSTLRVDADDLRYCLGLLASEATPIESYRQLRHMEEYLQGRYVV